MLRITVPGDEFFDEDKEEFVTLNDTVLELEHSLASLSKWESYHEKPFLSDREKTTEEVMSYIEFMILTPNFPPDVLHRLNQSNVEDVINYIDAKMTATWFNETSPETKSNEVVTAELIYYWMVTFQIPFECENWHLNRLFTLLKICNVKADKPKKMSRAEIARRNRELNAKRKAQYNTKG